MTSEIGSCESHTHTHRHMVKQTHHATGPNNSQWQQLKEKKKLSFKHRHHQHVEHKRRAWTVCELSVGVGCVELNIL